MCSSNLIRPPVARYDYFLTFYFSWMDFIINSLIPFIIIIIANASVMSSVCKSRILMRQLGLRQTRSPRDTQLAYILFVSTFLFLLLTFPLRVFSIIEPYLTFEKKYLILLDGIMRFLLYLDHGCGFYLYTFTGELFRREMKKFIYECLFVICRWRVFSWSTAESRRHSELSCSNGGGGTSAGASYLFCSAHQQGQIQLQDSVSSNVGGKSSLHSLGTHRTLYHQCAHGRHPAMNSSSNSSSRAKFSPSIGQPSSYQSTISPHSTGLVKRHSSSCFESQYKMTSTPLTFAHAVPSADLDRKSDIVWESRVLFCFVFRSLQILISLR